MNVSEHAVASPEGSTRPLAPFAWLTLAFALGLLHRKEEQTRICAELVHRFRDAPEAAIQRLVKAAMGNLNSQGAPA